MLRCSRWGGEQKTIVKHERNIAKFNVSWRESGKVKIIGMIYKRAIRIVQFRPPEFLRSIANAQPKNKIFHDNYF